MENPGSGDMASEIELLRCTLDAEMRRSLDLEKKLSETDAEFERFVSIAAHNLRGPLRDVDAFSQLLAEACAGTLDAEGGMFLDRIRDGAVKMRTLLAAVVDYWAMRAGEPLTCRTDMEAVLCQALLYADKQITERSAVVTHDPLPLVMGEFGLLTKVVHHLISNAIEFCGQAPPCIHISSRRDHLECILSVRDNGPGIEPAFHERIFQPFIRLHGDEHPGNGLGLAFCSRAVGRLGGRMWVDSSSELGSTFFVSLSAAD